MADDTLVNESAPAASGAPGAAAGRPVVLRAEHVSVDYAGATPTHAVRDVSLELRRGEILGIAGESGCGKSTLAYALTRLLRPPALMTGGAITFYGGQGAGTDVLALEPAELRSFRWSKVSMVFQGAMNSLNPVTTLRRQFADIFKAHVPDMDAGQRDKRATELLELVGIDGGRLGSYPHELSGGMRQRVGIAMALALQPDIVVMDEPTTALDVVVQREILDEVVRLRGALGLSIIFITHDLSLLLELSDRMMVMYAGEAVELASYEDIDTRAAHPYTRGLLRSFPDIRGERLDLRGVPGTPPDLRHPPAGCAFRTRCDFAFEPCADVHPDLRAAWPAPGGSEARGPHAAAVTQQVACHLHDLRLRPEGPPPELTADERPAGGVPADPGRPARPAAAGGPDGGTA
jgi:peptide/nickel transport system ATP-binding protein